MSAPSIESILSKFIGKKIMIVGDVMVDEYLWGNVTRISPEAPVPVVSCNKRESRMGGAANVAINIKTLGAEPVMCTVIGQDEIGAVYKSLLNKRDMIDEGIIECPERITTVKTRVIGNHQQLLRVDQEVTRFIDEKYENLLLSRIEQMLEKHDVKALIFQDYDKGVLTPKVIEITTKLCRSKNIPTLVDPKKRSFELYHNVSFFKPNYKELVEGLNIEVEKGDTVGIAKAIDVIHKEWKVDNVMVTLSEKGVFISTGNTYEVYPAEIRDITDVSGAGDTVVSVAALGMAIGLHPFQCAYLANQAGGLVCEKVGVIPIEPDMLLNEGIILPGIS